jgi:hypothetical protein
MVDVAMLLAEQQPDANGNLFSGNIQEGSVSFSNPKGNAEWMTFVVSGAFYNPRKGTCVCQCGYCVGYSGPQVAVDPFTVGVTSTHQLAAKATYGDGTVHDFTTSSSWSSNHTSYITVGGSTGLTSGVAVGSANITALFPSLIDVTGINCPVGVPCPTIQFAPQSAGTVLAPDHVTVVIDQEGYPAACPSTGIYLRQMEMQVVDAYNNHLALDTYIQETFSNMTTNTCGNGQPIPASCDITGNGGVGYFIDTMSVSGNLCGSGISQSSGCGFSLTSTWKSCSFDGSNTLWTSPRVTHSNGVTVNGSSSVYTPGTQFH